MTTIVNLYGGPGTGKSTFTAYMYYLAKKAGRNVEMVREYVKDWAWEGRKVGPFDQYYFVGKHVRKESLLFDKVETVFTDSPVSLPVMYSRMYSPDIAPGVTEAARNYYVASRAAGHNHLHLFLNRVKPYVAAGRFQTEAEAKELDNVTLALLEEFSLPFEQVDAEEASVARWMGWKGLLGN